MHRGIGIARATIMAKTATEERTFRGEVNNLGRMHADLTLDPRALRLKPGRPNDLICLVFEPATLSGNASPVPVRDAHGRALTLRLKVTPRTPSEDVSVSVDCPLPGYEGTWADLLVRRAPAGRARWLLASAAAAAVIAGGCVLLSWKDPSAKVGHYEGKTPEEIQADLDTEVAWYAMEVSVASRITVPEGETRIEARIENPSANHCDQRVRIWETGAEDDVLFESGAIEPGQYLQYVELSHPLPVGSHSLTVSFQGYEREPTLVSDEGQLLGHDTFGASCAAEVTLEVTPAQGNR